MEYYFNELSSLQPVSNKTEAFSIIEKFARTCVALQKIGFKIFRSNIHLSQIEIYENYRLGNWIKDRSLGIREIQNKIRLLDTKTPLLNPDDKIADQLEWSVFTYDKNPCIGLSVAFLKTSISVSFLTDAKWDKTLIPIKYEYIDELDGDKIVIDEAFVKNASLPEHADEHIDFAIEKHKTIPPPDNWFPYDNYFPNVAISNELLSIEEFYKNNLTKSRGEQIAAIRIIACQVAELNHYKKDEYISKKNKGKDRIRDIYKSQNQSGISIFLSVDVEIGAFEVCDHKGIHIEEILFDGTRNGSQELDHSIRV